MLAGGRVFRSGLSSRRSSADDQYLRVTVLDVITSRATGLRVDPAESRDAAEEALVERPGPPGVDHRPVVEADRGERAAHLVRDREEVVVERAPHILGAHVGAVTHGLVADAHVRNSVHGHHAIGAAARTAEETAGPVVLEAAREDSLAAGEQGRPDRVSSESLDGLSLETEGHLFAAVDPLALLGREPHYTAGVSGSAASSGVGVPSPGSTISVRSTSFVRVSRSA